MLQCAQNSTNRKPKTENRKPFTSEWPYLLALTLMGLVLFGYRLGAPGLMDPDEGRYAEIAREMLALKDWLIPHLNAFPYLEKPPLGYWLTALSFKALGYTELAARLPAALSALGGVFLAYYLGRALWGPAAAFLGAAVLATSVGYVALGRLLTLDMIFTLWLNLGVGLGYLALSRGRTQLWPWAYLALGLAVLTKGPVAPVLAGLIWGFWVLIMGGERIVSPPPQPFPLKGEGDKYPGCREGVEGPGRKEGVAEPGPGAGVKDPVPGEGVTDPGRGEGVGGHLQAEGVTGSLQSWLRAIQGRPWRSLVQPRGWLLLAAVALPWFVLVQWRYPQFFRFFILEQNLGRYLTPAIHPQPVYYYLPVLLGLALPWSWLWPWALASRRAPRNPDQAFLLIWAGAILVFFSLSRGKLPPYILPALLPLALLLGYRLQGRSGPAGPAMSHPGLVLSLAVWGLVGWGLAALAVWPPAALLQALTRANLPSSWLLLGALLLALTPSLALIWRRPGVLLLGALLLSAMAPAAMDRLSRQRSPRDLALALKSHWQPGAALVGVGLYSQGLSFYSGQVFHLLYCGTELDFGSRLAPAKDLCLADGAALRALAAGRPRVFLLVKDHDLPFLEQELPGKLETLGHHKDCFLLSYKGKY